MPPARRPSLCQSNRRVSSTPALVRYDERSASSDERVAPTHQALSGAVGSTPAFDRSSCVLRRRARGCQPSLLSAWAQANCFHLSTSWLSRLRLSRFMALRERGDSCTTCHGATPCVRHELAESSRKATISDRCTYAVQRTRRSLDLYDVTVSTTAEVSAAESAPPQVAGAVSTDLSSASLRPPLGDRLSAQKCVPRVTVGISS